MATRPPSINASQDPALSRGQNTDPAAYAGPGRIYQFDNETVVVDTDKQVFITVEEQITNQNFITVQQSNANVTGVTSIVAGNNVTITSTGANGTGRVTINANASGGNGTPGGVDGQVQYNANGAFAGSGNLTFNASNGTLATTNVRAQYGFMASAELGNIDVGISSDPLHDAIFNNATDTALNIRSGNTANSANGIFIYTYGSDGDGTGGGEVDVAPNGVRIHGLWSANAANAKTWNFANTGAVTFPDSTVQSTAWTGTVAGANVTGPVANATFATTAGSATTAGTANSVAGANVTGQVGSANFATFSSQADTALTVAGANVTGTVANATFATTAGSANTATTAGTANSVAVANVVGIGNIATTNYNGNGNTVLAGNGAWVAQSGGNGVPGGANTELQFNNNGAFGGITGVTSDGVKLTTSSSNIRITGGTNGLFLQTDGTGNLTWGSTPASGPITVAGANSQLQYNDAGNLGASANLTFNNTTNTLSTTNVAATRLQFADATVQNTAWTGTVAGANVTGTVANATFATTAGTANSVAGANVTGAVANATFATTAGSATTAGTANSVAGANVTGAVANATFATTAGNAQLLNGFVQDVTAAANSIVLRDAVGRIAVNEVLGTISGSNVSGPVASATTAGTVTTNAQPNITSVGVLSSLQVGNGTSNVSLDSSGITMPVATTLTAGRLVVQGANATLGDAGNVIITGGANGQVLTTDGSGNLSWTTVSGGGNTTPGGANGQVQFNANGAFGGSANFTFSETGGIGGSPALGVGQRIALVGNSVTNNSHLLASNELTVMSASGGNIVLDPSGNVVLPTVAKVKMPGGANGQVLTTDGTGNLSFANVPAPSAAGANAQIQFNANGALGGSANFKFTDTVGGGFVEIGTGLLMTGNGTISSGVASADGNIYIQPAGNLVITAGSSNIVYDLTGALTLPGNLNVNTVQSQVGQPLSLLGSDATTGAGSSIVIEAGSTTDGAAAGGSVEIRGGDGAVTDGSVLIGTINTANINIGGANVAVGIGGNVTFSNGFANLGSVSNVKISGGNVGQFLQTDGAGNLSFANVPAPATVLLKEFHVSPSGNDTTGTGTQDSPYQTVTKAITEAGNGNAKVILHVGGYNEDVTISEFNIVLTAAQTDGSGLARVYGNLNISGNATSTRLQGITANVLNISNGTVYGDQVTVLQNFVKTGTGYTEFTNSDLQVSGNVSITANATAIAVFDSTKINNLVAGANSAVVVKNSIGVANTLVDGGSFSTLSTGLTSLANGANALATTANGGIVALKSTAIVQPDGGDGRISIGASLYRFDDVNYDAANSTLGSALSPSTAYFQNIVGSNIVTAAATLGNVANVKIGGGANGQVLTTDGAGNLSFTTPTGGNTLLNVLNVTATPFAVTANTQFLFVTSGVATTIELPETVVVGSEIIVKDGIGTNRVGNAITVSVANGTIDGNSTYTINAAWNSVTFVGVGANTYAAI